jgi:hypothetical protein
MLNSLYSMVGISINTDGIPVVTHRDRPPTVYLDHWALRELSEQQSLGDRFIGALQDCGGTLALSWANLVEFGRVEGAQRVKAEDFLDRVLPNLFFIEVDPFAVIEKEDELIAGRNPSSPPHADIEFLRIVVGLKADSIKAIAARTLFDGVEQGLGESAKSLADAFVSKVEALRTEHLISREFQSLLARRPTAPQLERATRTILRELLRSVIVDHQTTMDRHHAMDFFHAVVPIAYCEFVALDKYWETQVARVRSRLRSQNTVVPIANVFSKKKDGLNRLVLHLESP